MSTKYFEWNQDFGSVDKLFFDLFGKPAINKLSEYSSEDLSWLFKLFPGITQDKTACLKSIGRALVKEYRGIRLYHLCRPLSVNSYYKHGFKRLDANFIKGLLFSIDKRLGSLYMADIDQAVNSVFSFIEELSIPRKDIYFYADKEVAFCVDGKNFLSCPEIMSMVFNKYHATNPRDLYEIYKKIAIPTIFVIDVPFDEIGEEAVEIISRKIAWKWVALYFDNQSAEDNESLQWDTGINIPSDINLNNIVYHRHPRDHKSFDDGGSIYCDKCKNYIKR